MKRAMIRQLTDHKAGSSKASSIEMSLRIISNAIKVKVRRR